MKDDFPDPLRPTTIRLMAWHGSGSRISLIFCKSPSFILNHKVTRIQQLVFICLSEHYVHVFDNNCLIFRMILSAYKQ